VLLKGAAADAAARVAMPNDERLMASPARTRTPKRAGLVDGRWGGLHAGRSALGAASTPLFP
jgi:hypothetical protein